MAASFTVSQSGLTPGSITATDTSTGLSGTITQRRIFFQTTQGTYLVETGTTTDYEPWALADVSDSWSVLQVDKSLAVTVQWLNSSNVVVDTLTQVFCFARFNKNFFYYLLQLQGLTPGVVQDNLYTGNMGVYWMNIVGADNAITYGADIAASQKCLDRATEMMQKQAIYFA